MNRRDVCVAAAVFAVLLGGVQAVAQPASPVYRVGFLTAVTAKALESRLDAFRDELRVLGYVEGKNLIIRERYANGQRKSLPELAAALVGSDPHVIVVHGDSIARITDAVAEKMGKTVPIVLGVSSDPVGSGIVASFAKPGGNITGLSSSSSDLVFKRLEFIKEVVPHAHSFAVLWDPRVPPNVRKLNALKSKATSLGITLLPIPFTKTNVKHALDTVRNAHPHGLIVLQWGLVMPHFGTIADFALMNRLPTIGGSERFVTSGGLMSYSTDGVALYRRAAAFVDKILKGAKPANLPVEQPSRFKLSINLKTAKHLGIAFPQSILLRADQVID